MTTMDVSMVLGCKATSPSIETQISLVQVDRRSFVIRLRKRIVVSNLGGGISGPRGGANGPRRFGPSGSPHSPLGGGRGVDGARPGTPPTFSPEVNSRRPARRTRPNEEPPMLVGGAPSPSLSSSYRESKTPTPLADGGTGDNGGLGDNGGSGDNGGRGNGKKLGTGGNGQGDNSGNNSDGRGYDQYREVFRSLNPLAGVLGVSFAFLGGTALYNAGSSILGGPLTTANALQKPPDLPPKRSVAAVSDPFGEEMMAMTEVTPPKVSEWGLLQFKKKSSSANEDTESEQVENSKPFFRCRDVIEIFDAISGKSTTSLMLGFGEVASLAISLPLDASNGKLVMGPHEVVLNAQTDMVDMKYDFTARNALIDLKLVSDDRFDMKLGFKSGRQWPNVEACYKYKGIPIVDATQCGEIEQLRSTISPDQRSIVVGIVTQKALLNGKINTELEANSNREVKGTATVVSPFWGWNLQVSANASLAGTTINNVDAVLNKSFMV